MTVTSSLRAALVVLTPVAMALGLLGCAADEPAVEPATTETEATATTGARTYTVRGRLVELPNPDDPTTGLYIHHEPIDDYVDMDGEVSGMDSMTMPFASADDLDLDGLAEQDKVEFDLAVDWQADPMVQVTRLEKIDPGTELEFRKARPPEP